jgi:UDP-N-acetylmuramoyl-tripeptide--D-alanyl-D-alanine ligase
LGRTAAESTIAGLYVAGEFAPAVAAGAMDRGMNPDDIFTGSKEQITETIKHRLGPGDWVLVKGSRGMAMETIVQELVDCAHG